MDVKDKLDFTMVFINEETGENFMEESFLGKLAEELINVEITTGEDNKT